MRRVFIATVFLLLAPLAVLADDPATRIFGVQWNHGVPSISFSALDLLGTDGPRKLKSGLPQTIVARVVAYEEGTREPIAAAARTCRVVYDLWEDAYRVQSDSLSGHVSVSTPDVAQVYRRCLAFENDPVGTQALFSSKHGRRVYFEAQLELNPMSEETVEHIRRWLARPNTDHVGSDAFFGSFVGLFVNRRVGGAERVLAFRSQIVGVP